MTTEQAAFWTGNFGNEYTARNRGEHRLASNVALFSKVLGCTRNVTSIIEFGANVGLNLMALKQAIPESTLSAVEINESAAGELTRDLPDVDLRLCDILDFDPDTTWDLVFTKGVLIHINPDKLPTVYRLMYQSSERYILVAEYYNPTPIEVVYRGHRDKLFKRDFAGEMMDMFSDLSLVSYGFVYRRDPDFPLDDVTWFLMEKETLESTQ